MNYRKKYLKYKLKYMNFKNKLRGGGSKYRSESETELPKTLEQLYQVEEGLLQEEAARVAAEQEEEARREAEIVDDYVQLHDIASDTTNVPRTRSELIGYLNVRGLPTQVVEDDDEEENRIWAEEEAKRNRIIQSDNNFNNFIHISVLVATASVIWAMAQSLFKR